MDKIKIVVNAGAVVASHLNRDSPDGSRQLPTMVARRAFASRYEWAYIFAAVCPERDTGAALVMRYANTEAMNLHLQEISRAVAPGAHAALVFNGAGWHTGPALEPPDNITPICLPPYAPELNPTENIWQYLRQNYLALRFLDDYDAIVDASCKAWNDLLAMPESPHLGKAEADPKRSLRHPCKTLHQAASWHRCFYQFSHHPCWHVILLRGLRELLDVDC